MPETYQLSSAKVRYDPRVQASRRALSTVLAGALGALSIGASCGQRALGILPGVVNDTSNRTLRADVLRYGTDHMCSEVGKRSMPLRLRPEDPSIGRFFATKCENAATADGGLSVRFGGFGYVWTNVTGRVTFEVTGSLVFDTDFQMDGSTMYAYFRPRPAPEVAFTTRVVERAQASLLLTGLPLFGQGGRGLGDVVGAAVVRGQIGKGFTVVREPDGAATFALGVVPSGSLASLTPFKADGGKLVVANERAELHREQRDFVGPIEVKDGASLVLEVAVDGAPAVDVLLVPRGQGEVWLQQYALTAAATPPPSTPLLDETVSGAVPWTRTLSPPAGLYYMVLDETASAGHSAPAGAAGEDHAALVRYGIATE
jgi:hypothetical protein